MEYDSKTALIVVDIQNDFADPKGSLYVSGAEQIIPAVNAEIERATRAGALVVYTQDWHPERTPHFQKDGGLWPAHCVQESWGAQLHPSLKVQGEIVRKGSGSEDGYSGFSVRDARSGEQRPTVLEDLLRRQGIERVVVVGLATDYCVKETALDALRKGFATTVLPDLTKAANLQPGDDQRALLEIQQLGGKIQSA